MKERHARRIHLSIELAKLESRARVASLDATRLTTNLRERLTDWQGLLQRQTAEARQILRKLLIGRLVFTPREDERGRYYEFAGKGSISDLVSGVVSLPKDWWPQRDSIIRRGPSLEVREFPAYFLRRGSSRLAEDISRGKAAVGSRPSIVLQEVMAVSSRRL